MSSRPRTPPPRVEDLDLTWVEEAETRTPVRGDTKPGRLRFGAGLRLIH